MLQEGINGGMGMVHNNGQNRLDSAFKSYTMRFGTRWSMVFSYLNTSRSDFRERNQPLKAMFSRATLGLGGLLFFW
jgi:hypothetical protein